MFVYSENIFQALAFVCGLAAWGAIRPTWLRWSVLLLGATVLNESGVVLYMLKYCPAQRDVAYNIFSLMDMGIWLYVFYRVHKGRIIRKWVIPAAVVIYLYTGWELYYKGWATLHTDSFRLYEIVILLLSCSYLYSILKKEYHVLMSDVLFWICAACIIYHSVLFLNLTTLTERRYWHFKNAGKVFDDLQTIGNIFYYLFLSFAFIICFNSRSKANKTDFYQE